VAACRLDPAAVHALMVTLIAAMYVRFAVSDGRTSVIAAKSTAVAVFFIAAAVATTVTAWLLTAVYLAGFSLRCTWLTASRTSGNPATSS
jgi:hypothetical protein